jgi:hypothetical protein
MAIWRRAGVRLQPFTFEQLADHLVKYNVVAQTLRRYMFDLKQMRQLPALAQNRVPRVLHRLDVAATGKPQAGRAVCDEQKLPAGLVEGHEVADQVHRRNIGLPHPIQRSSGCDPLRCLGEVRTLLLIPGPSSDSVSRVRSGWSGRSEASMAIMALMMPRSYDTSSPLQADSAPSTQEGQPPGDQEHHGPGEGRQA